MRFYSGWGDGDAASDARFEAWTRRVSAPENEAPAALPFSAVLGRTDETAVFVSGFRVYTTGFAFTLSVRLRSEPRQGEHFHELLFGGYGVAEPAGNLDERLLLGVEYADGRTATSLTSDRPPRFEADPAQTDELLLRMGSGGGGGRSYDHELWLCPLPPAGPVIFVCRWPGFGITENQIELDGRQIVAAAERVQTLWPWEPRSIEPDPEPPEPQLPSEGWFASERRRPRDR